MKTLLPIILFVFVVISCSRNNFDKDKVEIKAVMDKQSQCWSNGDINGFMDGY